MERKNITKLLILFSSILIAIILGVAFSSINAFFSFLLIELWTLFSIKFFKKRKKLNEYNSPKNTSFFVLVPMIIGIFYSFWGYITPLLGENLLEGQQTIFIFSIWSFIFAFPYQFYGLNALYSCFTKKKFNLVYIYRRKSVDARKFAYFLSIFIIILIVLFWFTFYAILRYNVLPTERVHNYMDLQLVITMGFTLLLLFWKGWPGKGSSIPLLSTAELSRRLNTIDQISTSPRPTRTYSQTSSTRTRTTPRVQQTRTVSRTKSKSKSSQPRARKSVKKKFISTGVFNKFKPKAGIINIEDFKCIFCFKLPKLPDDRNVGVILCPNCRYPAHANEFRDWLSSSKLCSRCDTQLPASFIHNPKVISTANYVKVIQKFRSRNR
jgi:hypothetical protein